MAKKKIYSILLVILITLSAFSPAATNTRVHATQSNLGESLGVSGEEAQLTKMKRALSSVGTYEYKIYKPEESLARNFLFPDGKELGESIFTNVQLLINGVEVSGDTILEYHDGMQIELVYDWEIPDDLALEHTDWASIKVPEIFKVDGFLVGTLYFDDEEIGAYYLDEENYLLLVFNEALIDKEQRKGQAGFAIEFSLKEFNDNTVQQIEFGDPINKSFTIGLKPSGEHFAVSKGLQKNPEINATHLEWFIDVNTTLDSLENGIVKDKLPEGLKLEQDSLEVIELQVGFGGKLTEGAVVSGLETQLTDDGLEVSLGETNKAYRIKFRTKISDSSVTEYKNTAFLYDDTEEKNSAEFIADKVQTGSLIEKSGKANHDYNPSKITWTIDVNQAEQHLTDVVIHDERLDDWLTIHPQSIRVYELVKNGTDWETGADVSEEVLGERSFPISLGNLNGTAYRIEFDTEIDFKSYQQENVFSNTAVLTATSQKEESTATVEVVRPSILRKFGDEITSYQDSVPVILWTVYLNEARQVLDKPVLTDTLPAGLELVQNSIVVLDSGWNEVPEDEYTLIKTESGFTLSFHNEITDYYKIEYKTLVHDLEKETFTNHIQLDANGIGEEDSVVVEQPVSPSITNEYRKSYVRETVAGTDYHGIDYQEKTMSWKLTVDAKKETVSSLHIQDTFIPEKSMKLLEDTLVVVKSGSTDGKSIVDKGLYQVTDRGVSGFSLEFLGELERTKYEIYYKTSFDVNAVLGASGALNNTNRYFNQATFTGKTRDSQGNSHDIEAVSEAGYHINDMMFNSGYKTGTLFRNERKIEWEAYFNMHGQTLTESPYVITDTLSKGQIFDPDTLEVFEYTLEKDGTVKVEAKVQPSQYHVTTDSKQNSFMITFDEGVSTPVMIRYTSLIVGLSEKTYHNTATTKANGIERTYTAKVTYPKHNHFVSKELMNQKGGIVYTDDELNWSVTLNTSLSEIKSAKFLDTIRGGHEYVTGSLRIYKGAVSEENRQIALENSVQVEQKANGDTTLLVTLGDIKDIYRITYDTVVVSNTGTIANQATLLGNDINSDQHSEKEFEIRKTSWGMGSGKNRGSLQIVKIDKNQPDTVLAGAGFELWYLLNGKERPVEYNGKTVFYTDEEGKLTFLDLVNGREYIVKEVEPPLGYHVGDANVHHIVAKSGERATLEIPNEMVYGSLEIRKTDQKTGAPLRDATFSLYKKDGTFLVEKSTNAQGIAVFENLEYGEYIFSETKAPAGYVLEKLTFEFSITEPNQTIVKTITNRLNPSVTPEEPEEPKGPEGPEGPEEPKNPDIPDEGEERPPTLPEIPTTPPSVRPEKPTSPSDNSGKVTIDKTPNKIISRNNETIEEKTGEQTEDYSSDNPDTGGPLTRYLAQQSNTFWVWIIVGALFGGAILWIVSRKRSIRRK